MPEGRFSSHGGSCSSFSTGDKVPWKSLTYNHTKDFLIVDLAGAGVPATVHRITGGMLEGTYHPGTGPLPEDFFLPGQKVVGYWGNGLDIHSIHDLQEYRRDTRDYEQAVRNTRDAFPDYRHELFKLTRNRPGDQSSPEYREFLAKSEDLMKRMDEVREKRQALLAPAVDAYRAKWSVPDAHTWERTFGCFLESSTHPMFEEDGLPRAQFQSDFREWHASAPEDLLERFSAWNGAGLGLQEKTAAWTETMLGDGLWQFQKGAFLENESLGEDQER
jgi:hypothetical protein